MIGSNFGIYRPPPSSSSGDAKEEKASVSGYSGSGGIGSSNVASSSGLGSGSSSSTNVGGGSTMISSGIAGGMGSSMGAGVGSGTSGSAGVNMFLKSDPLGSEERPQGTQLSDFIQQLEDYVPTVPDAVAAYYLNSAGFDSDDPRIVRLISIATQKFISDIAVEAVNHCKLRTSGQSGTASDSAGEGSAGSTKSPKPPKDRKYTLTIDDLIPALAEFGITVRKSNYFL